IKLAKLATFQRAVAAMNRAWQRRPAILGWRGLASAAQSRSPPSLPRQRGRARGGARRQSGGAPEGRGGAEISALPYVATLSLQCEGGQQQREPHGEWRGHRTLFRFRGAF